MDNQTNETTAVEIKAGNQGLGFVLGLLAGSLIGAATAIILTPQSGDKTRELLKAKADEARVKAGEVAVELNRDLGEWTEKTKATVVTRFRERLNKGQAEASAQPVAEVPAAEPASV